MPRRILCPLQTKVRRISFAKSCVTKSPEAEKAKTMEEIAPPKTPQCKHEKKIKNLMHKRHVKRTKYICVDLSFWWFQTSKHYFCISFFIARSHWGLGLSACLDFLHRAAIENASLAMMPCSHFLQSHEATLFFASLCGTRFIRVHDTFMISSWYFIILVRIGSCWFMIGVVCMRYAMLLLRLSKIFSSVRGISELSWQLSAAASLFLWSSS